MVVVVGGVLVGVDPVGLPALVEVGAAWAGACEGGRGTGDGGTAATAVGDEDEADDGDTERDGEKGDESAFAAAETAAVVRAGRCALLAPPLSRLARAPDDEGSGPPPALAPPARAAF